MFQEGQKVVCVNDTFPPDIVKYYIHLPIKDQTYTIRSIGVGVDWHKNPGEIVVTLVGLSNPRSTKEPYPERGFNADRFRPLNEFVNEIANNVEVKEPVAV